MPIYSVDLDFNPQAVNPYDNGGRYTDGWILFRLLETAPFHLHTGGGLEGLFQVTISKKATDWTFRLCDFIQYETALGKNILLAVTEKDRLEAETRYAGHRFDDPFLREYESPVLVHTTGPESYALIRRDGCLKSWSLLHKEKALPEQLPIGARLLGDPRDYADYIAFSHGGAATEQVVAARQKGTLEIDMDAPYLAGARLYFDAASIAAAGLLVRDGVHWKVKNRLPLQNHLLYSALPEELGLPPQTTPRQFARAADAAFYAAFPDMNRLRPSVIQGNPRG